MAPYVDEAFQRPKCHLDTIVFSDFKQEDSIHTPGLNSWTLLCPLLENGRQERMSIFS